MARRCKNTKNYSNHPPKNGSTKIKSTRSIHNENIINVILTVPKIAHTSSSTQKIYKATFFYETVHSTKEKMRRKVEILETSNARIFFKCLSISSDHLNAWRPLDWSYSPF